MSLVNLQQKIGVTADGAFGPGVEGGDTHAVQGGQGLQESIRPRGRKAAVRGRADDQQVQPLQGIRVLLAGAQHRRGDGVAYGLGDSFGVPMLGVVDYECSHGRSC